MAKEPSDIPSVNLEKFSTILYRKRMEKGLSQSDLARMIWGQRKDSRGYLVAKNRAQISNYESGRAVPGRTNLKMIAEALETTVEELAPDLLVSFSKKDKSPISLSFVPGDQGLVHLRVNTLTSFDTATKVLGLLSDDEATRTARYDGE